MTADLSQLLVDQAATHPSSVAFRFLRDGETDEEVLSYAGLAQAAQAVAGVLQERGIAPGSRVLLLCPPGLDFIKGFFACLRAGVVAVPVPPPHECRAAPGLGRLGHIIRDCEPAAALTTGELLGRRRDFVADCPALDRPLWIASDLVPSDADRAFRDAAIGPDTLVLVQYTSGSTSEPKGVVLTHAQLLANQRLIRASMRTEPGDIGCGWLPLYHDMGLIGLVLHSLCCGIETVLMPPACFLQQPLRWLRAVSRYRATISGGPSFAYELCVRRMRARGAGHAASGLDLSSWAVAFNGAEPVRADVLESFAETFAPYGFRREAFLPCYGLAEATLLVTGASRLSGPKLVDFDREELESGQARPVGTRAAARRLVSSGSVPDGSDGTSVLIVDPQSRMPCEDARVGEIWVRGPSIACRYWRADPDVQAGLAATTANGESGFLRTGDLGFIGNGELFITGRLKELMILHGRNLYPQDIEAVVRSAHPELRSRRGAAITVLHNGEEQPLVIHEIAGDTAVDFVEVMRAVRLAVARELELPLAAIVLVPPKTIPQTPSGKTRRREVAELYGASRLPILAGWRDPRLRPKAVGGGDFELVCAAGRFGPTARWSQLAPIRLEADVAPRTGTERAVLEILRREHATLQVGMRDSLFEIGADSLFAVQLVFELRQRFGVEIDASAMFEQFTIEWIAALIDAAWRSRRVAGPPKTEQGAGKALLSPALESAAGPRELAHRHEATFDVGASHVAAGAVRLWPDGRGGQSPIGEAPITASGHDAAVPMTSSQEALWAVTTGFRGLYANGGWRNLWQSVLVEGSLDLDVLRWSIEAIVRRHEILRTTFPLLAGVPSVRISPSADLAVEAIDLSLLSPAESRSEIQRMTAEASSVPRDLRNGPLLLFKFVKLGPSTTAILAFVDHMVFDGWSIGIFVSELNAIYPALLGGRSPDLRPLPIQYGDYARWQRRQRTAPSMAAAYEYWRARLARPIATARLSADRPRKFPQPFSLGRDRVMLPAALSAQANEFSRRNAFSLFSVLLAGFLALLWRLTGEGDVAVASAMANRAAPELQGLIGLFSNIVILRCRLHDDPSLAQLAGRVRGVVAGALMHQGYPLTELQRELFPRSMPCRTFFALQNYPSSPLDLPGARAAPLDISYGSGLWELNVILAPGADGLSAVVCYNAELFHSASIARILQDYQSLLQAALAQPERPLSEFWLPNRA